MINPDAPLAELLKIRGELEEELREARRAINDATPDWHTLRKVETEEDFLVWYRAQTPRSQGSLKLLLEQAL